MAFDFAKRINYRVHRHLDNRKARKDRLEFLVDEVCSVTGMSEKEATDRIQDAYKQGITYGDYMKYQLFLAPKEELHEALEKAQKKEKRTQRQTLKHFQQKIMEATGWDLETTKAKVREAKKVVDCTTREYFIFKLWNVAPEDLPTYFLRHHSKCLMYRYNSSKKFLYIAERKERTNEYFDEFVGRPWCVNTKISRDEFIEKFKGSDRVIYKPLSGQMGRGVEVYNLVTTEAGVVYDNLASYPPGIVEEYVRQHPEINRMCPTSVNTVRIVSLSHNGHFVTEDSHYAIAYAAFRIGGGKEIVDNFHSGGMVAGVDLATGTVVTNATDEDGRVFTHHPTTGTQIKGFVIPYFQEAVNKVCHELESKQLEGYLGWDIAISEDGPKLIEVNTQPGVGLLQTPFAAEGKGMFHVMEKYLPEDWKELEV